MPVRSFEGVEPKIGSQVWIAPDSWVIGQVTLGACCSAFFGAVVRGDILPITIGEGTNLQEHSLLHTSTGLSPVFVGCDVTIGHRAIVHGCTVGNRCIIGMGSTILDNAVIEENCIIGANSLVSMNTVIPAGHLAFGSPARPVRKLTAKEMQGIQESAEHYRSLGSKYLADFAQARAKD